jgi:hypothetical protein
MVHNLAHLLPALLSLKQLNGYGAFWKFNLTFSSMGHVCLCFWKIHDLSFQNLRTFLELNVHNICHNYLNFFNINGFQLVIPTIN